MEMNYFEEERNNGRPHTKAKAITVFCRVCHSRIRFDERPELYDIVTCPECDEVFEVTNVSPVQLDWPSELDDDDDDWDNGH